MCSKSFLYVAGVLSYRSILKVQACLHIGIHVEGENHSSIALVWNYAHELLHKERGIRMKMATRCHSLSFLMKRFDEKSGSMLSEEILKNILK